MGAEETKKKADCGGELLLAWLDAALSLEANEAAKKRPCRFIRLGKQITVQGFTTARYTASVLHWCCVCVWVGGGGNYINVLYSSEANEAAKTSPNMWLCICVRTSWNVVLTLQEI